MEHALEGMFCDPVYGGNKNFAGWNLLNYPGVRMPVPAKYQQIGVDGAQGPHVHLRRRPVRQGQEGGPGMSTRLKKTDVVIIGLGAAGGYASLALTRAGAQVVGLEAGPRWTADDFPMDELRNDVRNCAEPAEVGQGGADLAAQRRRQRPTGPA